MKEVIRRHSYFAVTGRARTGTGLKLLFSEPKSC